MYDDLLGPRKRKEEMPLKKKKYKLDPVQSSPPTTSPPPTTDDPWAGAGEDLVNEEEELELDLSEFDDGLDDEIEKALKEFVDEDEDEECEDSCMDCDGCEDDDELDENGDKI